MSKGVKANAESLGGIDKTIDSFTGLTGDTDDYLEHFLDKQEYKDFLEEHKKQKSEDTKARSEADKLIDISNEEGSIVVYWLKTEAAAKYYGRGTKWCTAAKYNNMFNDYNQYGKIYMIQIDEKGKKSRKYQMHTETGQFMDETDTPTKTDDFLKSVVPIDKEKKFTIWFKKTYAYGYHTRTKQLVINFIIPELIEKLRELELEKLIFNVSTKDESFDDVFSNELFLDKINNLKTLTFGDGFNLLMDDVLPLLTYKLETLEFGGNFMQPIFLDGSTKLINLNCLIFGHNFNKPIKLVNLNKLKSLELPETFNETIELYDLSEFTTLELSAVFNNRIVLHKLPKLEKLVFGTKFNQPLIEYSEDNTPFYSLNELSNLKTLQFGDYFNQPLYESLNGLTSLEKLYFGKRFNQPLIGYKEDNEIDYEIDYNSLNGLPNLNTLQFGDLFNQPLYESLNGLTRLEKLYFGKKFNQPLIEYTEDNEIDYNSLDGLPNLNTLQFGDLFNQPLYESLNGLTRLEKLKFGNEFNQPLYKSLNGLTKLQILQFGNEFNQHLQESLYGLPNLQILRFGNEFNQPLYKSLNGIKSLQILQFGNEFNQHLQESLYGLPNLQILRFGNEFNQPLYKSLNGIKSLQSINFGIKFNDKLDYLIEQLPKLSNITLKFSYSHLDDLKGYLQKIKITRNRNINLDINY